MKNRYEGLFVLNIKGSEDTAKDVIDRIEGEFKKDGAKIEQVQKLARKQFSYVAGKLDGGYYVNFIFQAEPGVIEKLRTRFKLDEEVHLQHYQKLGAKKAAPAEAAA